MRILVLKLIFALSLSCGLGNTGRYEIKLQTKNGEEFTANFRITTYDKLRSYFSSNDEFKSFFFNIYGVKHLDSLRLFKNFYYINYPEYRQRNEKLTTVLKEDWVMIAKSDIEIIEYKSFKMLDHIRVTTELNIDEIRLLRSKPVFLDMYSIDAYQEGYHDLWLLSYNQNINSKELNQMVDEFKEKYERKTIEGRHDENSWIYREMIKNWQIELKEKKVYLIEITNP